MREIKFRAWDSVANAFMPRSLFAIGNNGQIYTWTGGKPGNRDLATLGKHVTLMQYTGLKDKNGTEIYEGDIIRKFAHNPDISRSTSKKRIVCWVESDSYTGFNTGAGRNGGNNRFEVIGNIYESPELLK